MTIVSTMATTKDDRIYVRVSTEVKEEFEAVAEFEGLKPATLLHSLIVNRIYKVKKENPEAFNSPKKSEKSPANTITLEEAKKDNAKKTGQKNKNASEKKSKA